MDHPDHSILYRTPGVPVRSSRIHPGEALVKHGSILDLIRKTLPHLPPHIHLIEPLADVNTYDLMDVADLGLVYTTTVGLEMALRGIPVIVAGKTHYRNRGFTYDPATWVEYFKLLNRLLGNLRENRLTGSDQSGMEVHLSLFLQVSASISLAYGL